MLNYRRHTCECCKDSSKQEFSKILELENAGVAMYRYSQPQDESQISQENGEVFILQNSGVNPNIEELTEVALSGKKTISCARCRKMIERAKILFENLPPTKIREVTAVCNHCYQKYLFHCPCCDKIVDKFLRLSLGEQHKTETHRKINKSWLTKTQVSLKKSVLNITDGNLEPRIRLEDPVQESQAPVPIPTTKQEAGPSEIYGMPRFKSERIQENKQVKLAEDVMGKPLRVVSFLDFSEEQRHFKDRSDPDIKKKMRLAGLSIEESFKSVSFHAYSRTEFNPAEDIKRTKMIEEQLQAALIMEKYIQPEPKIEKDSKHTPLLKKYIEPKSTMEAEIKPQTTLEKDVTPKQIVKKAAKPKSIMKNKGEIKPEEDGVPKDYNTPDKKRKRSSPTRLSFDTVMKSMGKHNVSVFSYSFPRDKESKQIESHVSSSELIKNTQEMLAERAETAENERERNQRDSGVDIDLKQQEKKTHKQLEGKSDFKEELQMIDLKQQEKKTHKQLGGKSDFKEELQMIDLKQQEKKTHKQLEGGSDFKEELQMIDLKQQEKKTHKQLEGKSDFKEELQKGDKLQKVQLDEDKTKEREGKQRDLGAEAALKKEVAKEAKEKTQQEKLRKQEEKDGALREKKALEAEKAIDATQKQLTAENKIKRKSISEAAGGKTQMENMSVVKDELQKGDKRQKVDIGQNKSKEKDGKQRDLEAEAALNKEVAKEAKEKAEQEKLRKQEEKDAALKEKKALEAEKAIDATQKQLTAENKIKRKSISEVAGGKTTDSKADTGKGEKLANTAKEEKVKDGKHDDMMAAMREELAKQKQQELEKERIKKQQEKEKELAEKRLKDLQSKNAAENKTIEVPVLENKDEVSVDENVTEAILKPDEVPDIIIGRKIFKVKSAKKSEDLEAKLHTEQVTSKQKPNFHEPPAEPLQGFTEQKPGKPPATTTGDKKLKMNVYRMRPAKPEFDWFEHNKSKRVMTYDTEERLAEFDDNGRGRWYYRSGELALDYYDAEETNAGQRFVVYSTGQPDERGRSRPRTLLATFDYSGNGIVFDHTGKIRLKYNQTEGVVLDRTIGPVSHWKWHTLNDPPVLQQVMIDTQMPYKDPTILGMPTTPADDKRPDNEEMLAIEFENFLKEKRQKTTQSFKPFQIRMKAMKINEHFSLRILDQASIYLLFRDGTTNLKLNIGMVLDHKEIVDTDTAEICEVSNTLDKLPACTNSIAELQKAVAKAQAQERLRLRHEVRLKPPGKVASVDAMRAGCSRPLRTPVVHACLTTCDKMTPKRFKPSSSCNLYYSTQFF